jgi:hypothetical protein
VAYLCQYLEEGKKEPIVQTDDWMDASYVVEGMPGLKECSLRAHEKLEAWADKRGYELTLTGFEGCVSGKRGIAAQKFSAEPDE